MKNSIFAALAAAVLSVSASAAIAPIKLPAASLGGLSAALAAPSIKSVALPVLPAASFPSPLSINVPVSLPGAAHPLPLSLPARLDDAEIHLDWSFLDRGGDAAAVAVTPHRGPKPLPPAGAAAQLQFASEAVKAANAGRLDARVVFDHSRTGLLVEAD